MKKNSSEKLLEWSENIKQQKLSDQCIRVWCKTCRAININPQDYFEEVMRRIMSHPINRLEELLPDEWAP